MATQNQSNRDYAKNPKRIKPLRKDGLIIYWGNDGRVSEIRTEDNPIRPRLYKERE